MLSACVIIDKGTESGPGTLMLDAHLMSCLSGGCYALCSRESVLLRFRLLVDFVFSVDTLGNVGCG